MSKIPSLRSIDLGQAPWWLGHVENVEWELSSTSDNWHGYLASLKVCISHVFKNHTLQYDIGKMPVSCLWIIYDDKWSWVWVKEAKYIQIYFLSLYEQFGQNWFLFRLYNWHIVHPCFMHLSLPTCLYFVHPWYTHAHTHNSSRVAE